MSTNVNLENPPFVDDVPTETRAGEKTSTHVCRVDISMSILTDMVFLVWDFQIYVPGLWYFCRAIENGH